jgi:hypothetical protein
MSDWPYYRLVHGWLIDDDGLRCPFQKTAFPSEWTWVDAQLWLQRKDVGGTVRTPNEE